MLQTPCALCVRHLCANRRAVAVRVGRVAGVCDRARGAHVARLARRAVRNLSVLIAEDMWDKVSKAAAFLGTRPEH